MSFSRKSLRASLLLALAAIVGASSVDAQEFQITPTIGYRFFGSLQDWTGTEISVNDAMSWGGFATYMATPNTGFEFGFSRQDTRATLSQPWEGKSRFDVNVDYWTLGGVRQFQRPGSNLAPFAGGFLGLGRMSSSDGDESVTKFTLGAGGGAKIMPPQAPLGVRLEARGYFTFAGGGSASMICSVGGCGFGFAGQAFFQLDLSAGIILRLGRR